MNDWTTSHDRVLAQRDAEGWMFLIEAARDLRTTGAITPSGKALVFQRTDAAGRSGLYRVGTSGGEPQKVTTPQDASDPDWSGVLD